MKSLIIIIKEFFSLFMKFFDSCLRDVKVLWSDSKLVSKQSKEENKILYKTYKVFFLLARPFRFVRVLRVHLTRRILSISYIISVLEWFKRNSIFFLYLIILFVFYYRLTFLECDFYINLLLLIISFSTLINLQLKYRKSDKNLVFVNIQFMYLNWIFLITFYFEYLIKLIE